METREQLIEPMNLTSVVKRTLKPDLIHPDLDISLSLSDLKCLISLQSAKLLFAILGENLNEGMSSNTIETASVAEKNEKATAKSKKDTTVANTEANTNKLNLKLTVELNKIKLIIVELKTMLMNESYTSSYSNFSLLQISHLLFDYKKFEAGSWDAIFKMKALKLNDLRPDSNLAVKEMFVPRTKDSYFINLAYSVDAETNATLNFALDHIKINLCLPYILKLYSMVMEAVSSSGGEKNGEKETNALKKIKPLEHLANSTSFNITGWEKKECNYKKA